MDRQRFSRHLALVEIGEEGQRRLAAATAYAPSSGLAGQVARLYLEQGGVGCVLDGEGPAPAAWVDDAVLDPACRAVLVGSLCALDQIRAAVLPG